VGRGGPVVPRAAAGPPTLHRLSVLQGFQPETGFGYAGFRFSGCLWGLNVVERLFRLPLE